MSTDSVDPRCIFEEPLLQNVDEGEIDRLEPGGIISNQLANL